MLIDLFDEEEQDSDEYVSFIVFDPSSLRIPENDILLIGDTVPHLFDQVIASPHFTSSLKDKTLYNRLQRIAMMIDLLKSNNGLILTRFLSSIWRRYLFFSQLGELFVSKGDLHRLLPDYSFNDDMILTRHVVEIEPPEIGREDDPDADPEEGDNASQDNSSVVS